MFPALTFIVVCFGLVSAGPASRVKRQLDCPDSFTNVPNPCVGNTEGTIYYPHPTDATKFLQCDLLGHMYIIQCPQGLHYKPSTSSCTSVGGTITTTLAPTTTHAQTTSVPPTTSVSTVVPVTTDGNPCSSASVKQGKTYFPYALDIHRFIECDLLGNAKILDCPNGLLWEQRTLSCVYELGTNVTDHNSGTRIGTGSDTKAVDPANLAAVCPPKGSQITAMADLYHSYPGNNTKFVHCDLWGRANVENCPANLIWNDLTKSCVVNLN
ncbi:uncharacterized protein LOC125655554 [Ostrea edulis]|uniref:uncharacterized protein LOC125655554 n=1 Tax=Ostrea edulis TaxID=37623 RepID=UPI0024AF89EA|nr:uncharacterized protein LOC125655554 [Ostrea edulis]